MPQVNGQNPLNTNTTSASNNSGTANQINSLDDHLLAGNAQSISTNSSDLIPIDSIYSSQVQNNFRLLVLILKLPGNNQPAINNAIRKVRQSLLNLGRHANDNTILSYAFAARDQRLSFDNNHDGKVDYKDLMQKAGLLTN